MLDEWLKHWEEECQREAAARRGHNLVWKVLAPIAIVVILFRLCQLLIIA